MKALPVLVATFLFATVANVPVQAQGLPPALVGIVDMSVIVAKAKAYQHIRTEMDQRAKVLQADVDKMEKEFTKQREDLARQKTLLSPEAFQQRQQEFQNKFMSQAQSVDDRRTKLRETSDKASQEIQIKLSEIAGVVAQERGLNLVITGNTVLYAIRGYDISEEVLKRLDAQLPKVALPK
ncbi:MAG: OmpH family outer membrane protein [Alphaproteobacteria bacterium]|nr:OmpH family outer membrane protein [Alphaproteobacteria bacterium]